LGALDIFILLAITVGPTKAAAMYLASTVGAEPALKRQIAIRTVLTATVVCMIFALAGQPILRMFHISIPALLIAGGLILFVFALQLVLGEDHEELPDGAPRTPSLGLAAYPLAVPLMASPQGIVAIVIISIERPDLTGRLMLLGLLLFLMACNLAVLLFAEKIFSRISPAVLKVVMRIFGLLLCGLAVQLCILGLQHLGVLPGAKH
jgi:multiple antibiotic resistance protein